MVLTYMFTFLHEEMLELAEKPLEEGTDGAENGVKDVELEPEEDATEPEAELVSPAEQQLLESTTPPPPSNPDLPEPMKEDPAQNSQWTLTSQDVQRAKKIRVSPL